MGVEALQALRDRVFTWICVEWKPWRVHAGGDISECESIKLSCEVRMSSRSKERRVELIKRNLVGMVIKEWLIWLYLISMTYIDCSLLVNFVFYFIYLQNLLFISNTKLKISKNFFMQGLLLCHQYPKTYSSSLITF